MLHPWVLQFHQLRLLGPHPTDNVQWHEACSLLTAMEPGKDQYFPGLSEEIILFGVDSNQSNRLIQILVAGKMTGTSENTDFRIWPGIWQIGLGHFTVQVWMDG